MISVGNSTRLIAIKALDEANHLLGKYIIDDEFIRSAISDLQTFPWIKMVEGIGTTLVLSHRIYGEQAREEIGRWLQENGDVYERAIMSWQDIPSPSSLNEARSD